MVRLAWVGSLRVGAVRFARAEGEPKADGGKKTPLAPPAVCGISNAPRVVQKKHVKQFRATEGNGDEKARFLDFALSARAGSATHAPLFQGAAEQTPPPVCDFFNAARASRAQPEARAGRKRRREEKPVFLAHTF